MADAPLFLILTSRFPARSETFIRLQVEALKAGGLPVAVVANRMPQPEKDPPLAEGMDALYLEALSLRQKLAALSYGLWRYRHALRKVGALLMRMEAPLTVRLKHFLGACALLYHHRHASRLHLHAHFAYASASIAMLAAALSGHPYSLTLHGSDLLVNKEDHALKFGLADGIVTISDYNRDYLLAHYPAVAPEKVRTIRLGVPPAAPLLPYTLPDPAGPLRVLHVGRMVPVKDQSTLLKACAILRAQGVEPQLTFIGDGPLAATLYEEAEALGLHGFIDWQGAQDHDTVLAAMRSHHLFVLSSLSEGIPVAVMEAMQQGLPAIVTAITGVGELISPGVTGLLVPPGEPEALAAAMRDCATGRVDLRTIRLRARDAIEEHYHLEENTALFKDYLLNFRFEEGMNQP